MKLSLKALTFAGALVWGGAILLVSLINFSRPTYGVDFLQMTSSIYPWFRVSHSITNIFVGTIDGLIDGAVAAFIFAALYNTFARPSAQPAQHSHV